MPTGIEWTEETLNPWVGCTPVSLGSARVVAEPCLGKLDRLVDMAW